MRTTPPWQALVAACLSLCAGCGLSFGTQVEVEKPRLSALGESCEAPIDCEKGLSCIDLVCRTGPVASATDAGAAPPALVTRSGAGESCRRRTDCGAGLQCLDRTCRGSEVAAPPEGPRKGGRGESCVASNDCERGMGCVGEVCTDRDRQVSYAVNECHRVECADTDDCCKDFRPEDSLLCDELETSCKDGVQSDCNLYKNLCECSRICEDSVCVASVDCKNDLDCGGSGVLRCFAGKCAQCATDTDCMGEAACVGGLCRGGCRRNEECPLFFACNRHQCEEVGCQSDRDCFFMSGSGRSRCVEHQCRTPCNEDIVCTAPFQSCVEGYCTFVGCESDDECRAALMLANLPTSDPGRAACRPPAE